MAIEVSIRKEITEYKEKIIFGLSIRRLICCSLAVIMSIASYFLCTIVLGISMDTTSYIIIIESMPLMAIGFISKDGMPFEKYAALIIRHKIGINKLSYKTELVIDQIPEEQNNNKERNSKYAWIFEEQPGKSGNIKQTRKEKKQERTIRECKIFTVTKKSRKTKSKAARRKIKAARKDYRTAKRRAKKEAKKRGSTKIYTTTD